MYYFFRKLVEWYVRIRYHIVMHNEENLKKVPRGMGFIIACNHQKYADPPIIAAFIRAKYSFMAKAELFEKNKLFSFIIQKCGAFPVVRGGGDRSAIDRAIADIQNGRVFVIFPEGTRSKTGKIGKAKSGVALIAAMTGAPVLPVCLMYGLKQDKRRLDVSFGEMIQPEELKIDEEDRRAIRKVSTRIIGSVEALQDGIMQDLNLPLLSEKKDTPAES